MDAHESFRRKRDDGTRGLSLFDATAQSPTVAPSVPVPTSEDAAEAIQGSGRVQVAWHVILALLVIHDTLTSDEIEVRTGWTGNFLRPRTWEMRNARWLEVCDGEEGRPHVTRKTRTGKPACAMRLTDLGRTVARQEAARSRLAQEGR